MLAMLTNSLSPIVILADLGGVLSTTWNVLLILLGFSVVVFFHELGHFSVAKWAGVRIERFAVGFGPELFGVTRGETRYSFNILPLGGYVKMLGQEDFEVDKTGEIAHNDDPRSFINKPVGHRMAIVSAGVIMNLLVAALLFMVVYMIGRVETSPIVGQVVTDTPAAKAGLQVGDRIHKINDFEISSFDQIATAVRLAAPYEPMKFEFERDGQLLSKMIVPETSELNLLQVGIAPALTNVVVWVSRDYLDAEGPFPQEHDRIVEVNGQKIDDSLQLYVWDLMLQNRNRPSTVLLERPDAENPDAPPKMVTVMVEKQVAFEPNGPRRESPRDLLGLIPRVRVSAIQRKSSADYAGFQEGDLIVRWGKETDPTATYIRESILEREGKDIPVKVRRDGQLLQRTLYYRPVIIQSKNGQRKAKHGCKFVLNEQDMVVLAGINTAAFDEPTPASVTTLAKGCKITAVNNIEISGWADLTEKFRMHAGSTVSLAYVAPGSNEPKTTSMLIPPSLSTILDLPSYSGPYQRINFTLDGKAEVKITVGDKSGFQPAHYALAIRQYLLERIGQEVNVTYKDDAGRLITKSVTVSKEMVDPWYRRVTYSIPVIQTKLLTYLNQELNPVRAVWAGTMQTYYFVTKTYLTLKRLIFERTVGVEHMSGPVGIIRIGARLAELSKIEMLYFLALISANLAVINFLPLPIVDGGLMVFLIIEKIRGSPVSIRTQVVTQLIGIAFFATLFVLITFQDIAKWVG